MKILIIGSGGQLGTDCVAILGGSHEVTGIDFPDIDISERSSVENALVQSNPDCIVNCAAYTAVDRCETEKERAWKINATGRAISQRLQGPQHAGSSTSPPIMCSTAAGRCRPPTGKVTR